MRVESQGRCRYGSTVSGYAVVNAMNSNGESFFTAPRGSGKQYHANPVSRAYDRGIDQVIFSSSSLDLTIKGEPP